MSASGKAIKGSPAKVLVPTTSRPGSPPSYIITGSHDDGSSVKTQPIPSLLLPESRHTVPPRARAQPKRSSFESIPADRCASISQSQFTETNGKQPGGRSGPDPDASASGQTASAITSTTSTVVAASNCIDDPCLRQGCVLPNSGGHCSNAEKPLVDADNDNVAAATIDDPDMTMTNNLSEIKDSRNASHLRENLMAIEAIPKNAVATTKTGMDQLSHLEKNVFPPLTVISSSKNLSSLNYGPGNADYGFKDDVAYNDLSSSTSAATGCCFPTTTTTSLNGSDKSDVTGVNKTPSHLSPNNSIDAAYEVEPSALKGIVTSQTDAASNAEQKV